ncbi:MAG: hypothetical protein ACM3WV_02610 [Bacillota bacterium]
MDTKIAWFFEALDDKKLSSPLIPDSKLTFGDVIISQIRHIQYHVGHCNSILRHHRFEAVEWIPCDENRHE